MKVYNLFPVLYKDLPLDLTKTQQSHQQFYNVLLHMAFSVPCIFFASLKKNTSMAKQDNYKKERTETALSFHFSDFGMRGYISMVKPSGLFLRFSFSFW